MYQPNLLLAGLAPAKLEAAKLWLHRPWNFAWHTCPRLFPVRIWPLSRLVERSCSCVRAPCGARPGVSQRVPVRRASLLCGGAAPDVCMRWCVPCCPAAGECLLRVVALKQRSRADALVSATMRGRRIDGLLSLQYDNPQRLAQYIRGLLPAATTETLDASAATVGRERGTTELEPIPELSIDVPQPVGMWG